MALPARRVEIDAEIETLRRMARRAGGSAHAVALVAELEAERDSLLAPAADGACDLDLDALRPVIVAKAIEMRAAFEGAPDARRAAFRALLGDRRMRVLADAEQRFRIEGLFELDVEIADARSREASGRLPSVVAGGRSGRRQNVVRWGWAA